MGAPQRSPKVRAVYMIDLLSSGKLGRKILDLTFDNRKADDARCLDKL